MAQQNRQDKFPKPTDTDLEKIIQQDEGAELLVKCANEIGESLAKQPKHKQLSTSQIRAIFGEVRRIEGEWKNPERAKLAARQLTLLKPKMAYRAKKEKNVSVQNLVDVLSPAIDLVDKNQENFTRFVDFFEAILAYHKAHGGN